MMIGKPVRVFVVLSLLSSPVGSAHEKEIERLQACTNVLEEIGRASEGIPQKVELVSSSPPPGSTISLASLALSVRVRVKSGRDIAPGTVVLSLRPAGGPRNCVTLWSTHAGITADSSAEVSVSRVLFVECAPPFATQEVQATVRGPGETDVFEDVLPLSYSFVP